MTTAELAAVVQRTDAETKNLLAQMLVELVDSDLRRMSNLVRQYASLRLGGTDASVVAICERLGIVTVATVNLRDFATVRPRHIPAFMTLPGLG